MVAVEQQTTYKRTSLGDLITIRSGLLEMREKSLRFFHEMRNDESGELAAVTRLTGVYIDAEARKACSFPEAVLARGRGMIVD
jgi:acyl-CoA thioester hydrolase